MSKKILIIDDSQSMRSFTRMALEGAGYVVEEAVDGQDALDKLEKEKFDTILSDLNMPNVNGIQMIEKIRDDDRYESARFTPIIMLTTESEEEKKQQGQMAGARAWLVKPFAPSQLVAVMEKICPQD